MRNHQKHPHQCLCGIQLQDSQKNYCEQCTFTASIKLSQQIVRLRQKLDFYKQKNKQYQQLSLLKPQDQNRKLLFPFQNHFQKQFVSQSQTEKEINHLKDKLYAIDLELQQEISVINRQQQTIIELCDQIESIQKEQTHNQREYQKLVKTYYQDILKKQVQLNHLRQTLETTNIISIVYTITFQDEYSYLNGEKIIPDNTWKIVEILSFYQVKYQTYAPLVEISIDTMTLSFKKSLLDQVKYGNPLNLSQKVSKYQDIQNASLQITCEEQDIILSEWMPLIILQMKKIFDFLKNLSQVGDKYQLKYQINHKGEFQLLKNKKDLDILTKFNLTVKYLLTDIEQINKLQFFVAQSKLKLKKQKKPSQDS